MKPGTITAIAAIIRADPPATAREAKQLAALITPEDTRAAAAGPQIVTRQEAANLLRVSPRAIDLWAKEGVLKKVRLPGRVMALGFLKSDLDKLFT